MSVPITKYCTKCDGIADRKSGIFFYTYTCRNCNYAWTEFHIYGIILICGVVIGLLFILLKKVK